MKALIKVILIILGAFLVILWTSCSESVLPEDELTPVDTETVINELVTKINDMRTNGYKDYGPVGTIYAQEYVTQAAQDHTDYMSVNGLCHNWKDGTTLGQRLQKLDFLYNFCAEDVSKTELKTSDDILNYWLERECFCDMIMDSRPLFIGIAQTDGYWCVVVANGVYLK